MVSRRATPSRALVGADRSARGVDRRNAARRCTRGSELALRARISIHCGTRGRSGCHRSCGGAAHIRACHVPARGALVPWGRSLAWCGASVQHRLGGSARILGRSLHPELRSVLGGGRSGACRGRAGLRRRQSFCPAAAWRPAVAVSTRPRDRAGGRGVRFRCAPGILRPQHRAALDVGLPRRCAHAGFELVRLVVSRARPAGGNGYSSGDDAVRLPRRFDARRPRSRHRRLHGSRSSSGRAAACSRSGSRACLFGGPSARSKPSSRGPDRLGTCAA